MSDNSKLEEKLDRVLEDISEIKVTLASQHVSLVDHIRRTNLLETQVEPIKNHVAMVNGALKFVGILGLVMGIAAALIKITS